MIERDPLAQPAIVSWGAVFAGAATVLSVSVLLGLLGASLGFGMLEPQSAEPAEGLGLTLAIWTAPTLLISLGAGGFVAGYMAGAGGWAHGFLSWSVALVTALVLSGMAVSGTLRVAGSLMGTVASATGGVIATTADGIGDGVMAIAERIEGDVTLDTLEEDVVEALRATEIEALNPDRLEAELDGAREDVGEALSALRSRPDQFEPIVAGLLETLAARAEGLAAEIDRDEAVDALEANTDLTRPEAEAAVDDAIGAFQDLSDTAQGQIAAAQAAVEDARAELAQLETELRAAADEAAGAASRGALWAFVTLLLGAGVSVGAGILGRRQRSPYALGF